MRLAMRISAVDPDKARAEFRKGLENEFGVFEAEAERVAVSTKSGFTNRWESSTGYGMKLI